MRENSSLRHSDEMMTDNISSLLDTNVYNKFMENFERVYDKSRQVSGIDVIFDYNGRHYTCDEKAAVRYRNISTFTLELSFINRRGEVQEGWFLSDKCVNNSYLFIWIDNISGKECVEAALVNKKKLMFYLEAAGLDKETLRDICAEIRESGSLPPSSKTEGIPFVYSTQLVEEPINIKLSRDIYKRLADKVFRFAI